MKKIKSVLALAACILILIGCIPVSAITPYSTYTYDIDGDYMESPHAYVPLRVIDSDTLGLKVPLKDPKDFCVSDVYDENGNIVDHYICIADTGNARVIVVNSEYKVVGIIMDFVNEWGVDDAIVEPRGLTVDKKNHLYVCDTSQNRILVFDLNSPKVNEETGLQTTSSSRPTVSLKAMFLPKVQPLSRSPLRLTIPEEFILFLPHPIRVSSQ